MNFSCRTDVYNDKTTGAQIPPAWVFENSLHIDGIAERTEFNSILIKSATLDHNGQYTCIGYKRSKLTWINFFATAHMIVLGKLLTRAQVTFE